jgi:hypothetical protein
MGYGRGVRPDGCLHGREHACVEHLGHVKGYRQWGHSELCGGRP